MPEKFYTIYDVMDMFGVSQSTLWRERKSGRLTFTKVGGSVRFSQSDIDKYIEGFANSWDLIKEDK